MMLDQLEDLKLGALRNDLDQSIYRIEVKQQSKLVMPLARR